MYSTRRELSNGTWTAPNGQRMRKLERTSPGCPWDVPARPPRKVARMRGWHSRLHACTACRIGTRGCMHARHAELALVGACKGCLSRMQSWHSRLHACLPRKVARMHSSWHSSLSRPSEVARIPACMSSFLKLCAESRLEPKRACCVGTRVCHARRLHASTPTEVQTGVPRHRGVG